MFTPIEKIEYRFGSLSPMLRQQFADAAIENRYDPMESARLFGEFVSHFAKWLKRAIKIGDVALKPHEKLSFYIEKTQAEIRLYFFLNRSFKHPKMLEASRLPCLHQKF